MVCESNCEKENAGPILVVPSFNCTCMLIPSPPSIIAGSPVVKVATPLELVVATRLTSFTLVVLTVPSIVYISTVVGELFIIEASYLNE